MRIAVLDDDKFETEQLIGAINGWDSSRVVETFNDGQTLLKVAQRTPHFTVVFFDIFLPKENGMEIARRLHEISPETYIVFTSTSRDFAVEAFSMNALHYLVKPVTTKDICDVFDRVCKKQIVRKTVSIQVGKIAQALYLDEITVAQSHDHRMIISMIDGCEYETYMKCSELQESLGKDFLLVQRGMLVNSDFIQKMNSDSCLLRNGQTVLFSRKNKDEIRKAYNDYVFRRVSEANC